MKPEVYKKKKQLTLNQDQLKKMKPQDIIIEKVSYETEYNEFDGSETKRRFKKEINLTKKINETKKTIKRENATTKVENELEKIFSK